MQLSEPPLCCPVHGSPLNPGPAASGSAPDALQCPEGCVYPIVEGIPRFVDSEHYASSFGLQWRTFRKTQHDSANGTTLTRDRLERCLGAPVASLSGKHVLEAGCGSGRFTELLLEGGAQVLALDLSSAVEANQDNCGHLPHHRLVQASILEMPVPEAAFDVVVCLGVVQHTPDPEQTMVLLASRLRPGGLLVIDHYTHGTPQQKPLFFMPGRFYPSGWLREHLKNKTPAAALRFTTRVVDMLWPWHRFFWAIRKAPGGQWLRHTFRYYSPVIEGFDHYPGLDHQQLHEWAVLDTHDGHTDFYKHARSVQQIRSHLQSLGLQDIEVWLGGNGVEARARAPKESGTSE